MKNWSGGAAGIFVLSLALLMCMEVILRYVFQIGISWIWEVIIYVFVWCAWISIFYTQLVNRHVSTTFLTSRYSEKWGAWVPVISAISTFVLAVILSLYGAKIVYVAYLGSEVSPESLGLPNYIVKGFTLVGFIMLLIATVITLRDCIKHLYEVRKNR